MLCRCLDRADSPHLIAGSTEHRDGGRCDHRVQTEGPPGVSKG